MNTVSLSHLTTPWAARLGAAFDASGVHRVGTLCASDGQGDIGFEERGTPATA